MRALTAVAMLALSACSLAVAQRGNLTRADQREKDGDYKGALVLVEHVIATGPDDPQAQRQAYFMKAKLLEQLGRKKEAAGLLEYLVNVAGKTEGGRLAKSHLDELGPVCTVAKPP